MKKRFDEWSSSNTFDFNESFPNKKQFMQLGFVFFRCGEGLSTKDQTDCTSVSTRHVTTRLFQAVKEKNKKKQTAVSPPAVKLRQRRAPPAPRRDRAVKNKCKHSSRMEEPAGTLDLF